jgi:hypothetical protein
MDELIHVSFENLAWDLEMAGKRQHPGPRLGGAWRSYV